jgi:hypothetical protein
MARTLPWDPNRLGKCEFPDCNGTGKLVLMRPSKLYGCGTETYAVDCPCCLGSGRKPPTVADGKMAASGGAR